MVKILVIDDEVDVCDFTRTFFKERGFEVFCAVNCEEALSMVKDIKPDIVLLDILMKGADGITVLKRIKEIASSTVVVMVSAVDDIEKIKEAKALGATAYLTKPLSLEKINKELCPREL